MKCHLNVPEEKRVALFEHYWNNLSQYERQQDFLGCHNNVVTPKQKMVEGQCRRSQTSVYHFTVDGVRIKVCKKFFLQTLGETEDRLRYHREHKLNDLGSAKAGNRGRHDHHGKIGGTAKAHVHSSIKCYPAVESHYCRSRSTRRYLPQGLSVAEMYRQYRNEYCVTDNIEPVKLCTYRTIFALT